jgi:hypothetical protein
MSDEILKLEDRILDLEFSQLKKKTAVLRETTPPAKRTSCCGGNCRPCGAWKGERQMVMSFEGEGKHGREPHFPCSPNCRSAELLKIEERKRLLAEADRKRQIKIRGYYVRG